VIGHSARGVGHLTLNRPARSTRSISA
jgi:hypothetical protein